MISTKNLVCWPKILSFIALRQTKWSVFLHSFCKSNPPISKDVSETKEQHYKDNFTHDDDIMADAGSNVQPTTVVTYQEEEMLEKIERNIRKLYAMVHENSPFSHLNNKLNENIYVTENKGH